MKHCVNCEYHTLVTQEVPAPGGRMGMARIHACKHEECSNPVTGEPIGCDVARQDARFCDWEAKFFKLKEVKPEAQKSLIEVSK